MKLDPFLLIMLATVALASVLPASGAGAVAVDWVTTLAITLLFFLHGVRLKRETLIAAASDWKIHLLIMAFTFALFPLLGLGMKAAVPGALPPALWIGVMYLCALPSTVQSSIAFTSIARGNVAVAVCAAAFSNLAGVFVTPFLSSALLGTAGGVSTDQVVKIASQLLLPFVVGHLMRPLLGAWAERNRKLLMFTDRGTVVLAVYASFSAAIVEGLWHKVAPGQLAVLLALCLLLLALVLGITMGVARALGYARPEEIAIMFVGSKKSLASGVPMAKIIFPPAVAGAVILPIMIFHQAQLMACASIARRYAARDGD
ncbi:bile acid:sodium symporter family protein [Novosphingobium cyanobacteriorum]|uniref:Bile acid:sodium symporter n=1 Tax=Novosphingobium cyanobacteriorum TaxID=3024215 RepID=A0ABT6CRF1_9SPHN|nr:bile acid:sodium symporter family protein [Novosphingobium cyanobacteriorum]MDF8335132.1 bile acid:sodium symporter [Novosphingobium cyanobacteriorum]